MSNYLFILSVDNLIDIVGYYSKIIISKKG